MPSFQIYNVIPTLPAALEPLREMTFNLWWTWEPAARRLFESLPTFYRKNFLRWIESAKRPETRARRIAETVATLKAGKRER